MTRFSRVVEPLLAAMLALFAGPGLWGQELKTGRPAGAVGSGDSQWVKLTNQISREMTIRNVPSISIAVARNRQVVWERSFGWADRARRIAATPTTIYSLASITKPMVATAVLTLAARGRVDLDAPVERYIGSGLLTAYEGSTGDVTIRRLLHHTGGLPQHFNYYYADEPNRPLALEATARRFGIIVRAPGREFQYSNLGYALLGHVVEKVSGMPLQQFMALEIFRPLGLTTALFDPDPVDRRDIAAHYDNRGGVVPFHWSDTPGAAHAYASVHDLIRFGMLHLKDHLERQRPILDDRQIDLMQTEPDGAAHPFGPGQTYGLGWFVADAVGSPPVVWHEGGWMGASAMLKLVPSEDAAVAVLMNVFDSELVGMVADSALRALIPDLKLPEGRPSDRRPTSTVASFSMSAGTYVGRIHTGAGEVRLVLTKTDQGELVAQLGDTASALRPVREVPPHVPRAPGHLLVALDGPLGDPEVDRHRHRLVLDLAWVRGELAGVASAMAVEGTGNAASDPRMHFSLPFRVVLRPKG